MSIKPQYLTPDPDGIPEYLKRFPHWLVWRAEFRNDVWTKVPYDAKTMGRGASNDSSTWTDFADAFETYAEPSNELDGIGFVFNTENDLFGVDFDKCLDATGLIKPIDKWIESFNSYTEISVTGKGLHIIARGTVGAGRNSQEGFEIYDRGRYFTFTGKQWGEPRKLGWRQVQSEQFIKEMFPVNVIVDKKLPPIALNKPTQELLEIAFNARNGGSIRSLYDGDTTTYGNDDSSADMALASKLAFYSGNDAMVLDEMFRGSKLYRRKWDTKHSADGRTYGQMTVERALSSCVEFYSPNGKQQSSVSKLTSQAEPLAQGVYHVNDVRDRVYELYRTGRQPGEHPGWDGLAKLYTIKRKQFTVLTGIPNSGKSAVLDAILVNLSMAHGWKHAVCSVENQPIEQHISMLTEIHSGMPFSEGPNPRITKDELDFSLDWLHKNFTFVLPPEEDRTLEGIISRVAELEVDGVVVDPWNELEHRRPINMTETEYVSEALSKMRQHAMLFNQHWWLVAHPTKLQKDKGTGNYNVPTLYDISGSAHFRNKCDFGLVTWRDFQDPRAPTTVFVQKVRFRWCGEIGQCDLYFDKVTGRYSEKPNIYQIPAYREHYA